MMADHQGQYNSLLDSNKEWAYNFARDNPGLFKTLSLKQTPQCLWIGCSDSRIPESVVSNVKPGVIFTHRNIANQFHLTDDCVLASLEYAVENLNVRHVCVVGHTGCGGAEAAYNAAKERKEADSPLDRWLYELVQLILKNNFHMKPKEEALPLIIKENIKTQVNNILQTNTVVKAAASGRAVSVHGWIYNLEDGRIKDLKLTRRVPHGTYGSVDGDEYVWVP